MVNVKLSKQPVLREFFRTLIKFHPSSGKADEVPFPYGVEVAHDLEEIVCDDSIDSIDSMSSSSLELGFEL